MNELIASSGNRKNILTFTLSEFEGMKLLDIRKCYVDKDENLCPTRKGISLTSSNYDMLRKVIETSHDKIAQWLSAKDSVTQEAMRLHEYEKEYAEQARYAPQKYQVEKQSWKSPEFFMVKGQGGTDKLCINDKHPFITSIYMALKDLENHDIDGELINASRQIRESFEILLLAFGKTRHLYDSKDTPLASIIFDSVMINWGIYLERYSQT